MNYDKLIYESRPVKFNDYMSNKYDIVHNELYKDAFGGNLNPNNLCMKLNDIDRILGCNLSPCGTLINNDSIMKAVAGYIKDRLDKDNMSNKNMRDLIDRLPQFEDIVING